MNAAPKKGIDPYRRSLYAKIEIGKKALGLDDDTYRDLLDARYGKRSRKSLGNAQLVDLVEHFKSLGFKPRRSAPARAGRRKLADGDTQRKIRALWLSLYHLGLVKNPSESALAAFVKRQVKIDDLAWLDPGKAYRVIEALKSWASRDGGVDWRPYKMISGGWTNDNYNPRARVMEAQWRRLNDLGVVGIRDLAALARWAQRFVKSPCDISHVHLTADEADRVIEALGARIREAKSVKRTEGEADASS